MPDGGVPTWLPALVDVYDEVAWHPQPKSADLSGAERIRAAIKELRETGAPVNDRTSLLRYLVTSTIAVRRGDAGFDLSYEDHQATRPSEPADPEVSVGAESESISGAERVPAGAIRVFYGGAVAHPQHPEMVEGEVLARWIAEQLATDCTAAGHHAVTLEQLGHAAIIDRLDLWNKDDIGEELSESLESVLAEFPDWAYRVLDEYGDPALREFAGIVWREGLSTQYATEADGEAVVVNTKPYPGRPGIGTSDPRWWPAGGLPPNILISWATLIRQLAREPVGISGRSRWRSSPGR